MANVHDRLRDLAGGAPAPDDEIRGSVTAKGKTTYFGKKQLEDIAKRVNVAGGGASTASKPRSANPSGTLMSQEAQAVQRKIGQIKGLKTQRERKIAAAQLLDEVAVMQVNAETASIQRYEQINGIAAAESTLAQLLEKQETYRNKFGFTGDVDEVVTARRELDRIRNKSQADARASVRRDPILTKLTKEVNVLAQYNLETEGEADTRQAKDKADTFESNRDLSAGEIAGQYNTEQHILLGEIVQANGKQFTDTEDMFRAARPEEIKMMESVTASYDIANMATDSNSPHQRTAMNVLFNRELDATGNEDMAKLRVGTYKNTSELLRKFEAGADSKSPEFAAIKASLMNTQEWKDYEVTVAALRTSSAKQALAVGEVPDESRVVSKLRHDLVTSYMQKLTIQGLSTAGVANGLSVLTEPESETLRKVYDDLYKTLGGPPTLGAIANAYLPQTTATVDSGMRSLTYGRSKWGSSFESPDAVVEHGLTKDDITMRINILNSYAAANISRLNRSSMVQDIPLGVVMAQITAGSIPASPASERLASNL